MGSERSKLQQNENDSKNTRMNLTDSMRLMDFRKDELMHIARYFKACETAVSLSKKLGRPVRMLDLGCGEIYSIRLFYKSFLVKKSEVIKQYIGLDIDRPMLDRVKQDYSSVLEKMNGKLIAQDITTNPKLKLKDDSVDLIVWFEMVEHIKPEFVEPMLKETLRVLNPKGTMLLSTPNSNGSNKKLPKDHVYEWSYEDLKDLIIKSGFNIEYAKGVCINPSRIPQDVMKSKEREVEALYKTFGENTAYSCVALAPLFPVKYSKNMLFKLGKENE